MSAIKSVCFALSVGPLFASAIYAQDAKIPSTVELRKLLAMCEANLEDKNYVGSISHCRKGIDIIDKHYVSESVIDDSGMSLVLAQEKEKIGDFDDAAALYRGVFAGRLSMLSKRVEPK